MDVTLLGANLGTRCATDAQLLVRNGHYFLFVFFIVIFVIYIHRNALAVFGQAHQLQHAAWANLKATPTTDAFLIVQGCDESRSPCLTTGQGDVKGGAHDQISSMCVNQIIVAAAALRASISKACA